MGYFASAVSCIFLCVVADWVAWLVTESLIRCQWSTTFQGKRVHFRTDFFSCIFVFGLQQSQRKYSLEAMIQCVIKVQRIKVETQLKEQPEARSAAALHWSCSHTKLLRDSLCHGNLALHQPHHYPPPSLLFLIPLLAMPTPQQF